MPGVVRGESRLGAIRAQTPSSVLSLELLPQDHQTLTQDHQWPRLGNDYNLGIFFRMLKSAFLFFPTFIYAINIY